MSYMHCFARSRIGTANGAYNPIAFATSRSLP